MYRLLGFLFFFACANILTAQIADDFEFIDHKVRTAFHGVSKVVGTDFLYVSHNQDSWPMTSVILVNTLDNTIDTLLTTFTTTSSLQEFPDGSFQIFLTNIFDYDIVLPGFYSIESDGTEIEVNSFLTYDPNIPNWDESYFPISVAKNPTGEYIFNTYEYTHRLNTDGTVDTLYDENLFVRYHQSSDHTLYSYAGKELFQVNDLSQDLLLQFEDNIIDIENNKNLNDILFEGSLQRWNADFSQKIFEWNLPNEISNFYQLALDSLTVTATGLVQDGNRFYVQEFDLDGMGPIIYDNEYIDQGIKGFHDLGNSKYLLIGQDSLQDAEYNTMFFRNIDFNQEIEYQSRDLSIDSFELFQFEREDVFQYTNSMGDSVFQTFYANDLTLSFSNQSDHVVNLTDLRSNRLFNFWYFSSLDYAFEDLQLMPGESFMLHDTIQRTVTLNNMVYGIPGADFRFNNHPNKIAYVDFTADLENITLDVNLKLFPNPSTDVLNLELDKKIRSIEIFNTLGQLVLHKAFSPNLNRIDISRIESGSYFIRITIEGEEGYAVQQFVKL